MQERYWTPDVGPETTPVSVRISKGLWVDDTRSGRSVPYKIYHPEILNAGPYPVVVWSHGLGGTRDGAGFLGRYLAAHGFIHVHIQHDGTDDSLWRGMAGHPWDNIKAAKIPWETVRNRYLDASFAVDQLHIMNKNDEKFGGQFDLEKLGMSGHSFGALTTQVMTGQLAGREEPEDLHDARFQAGVLYSPVPAFRHQLGGQDVYAPIKKPLLHMTGTNDFSPVEKFGHERRIEVFGGAGHKDQHMFVLDDADHMVFNGSRGQLPGYEKIDLHQSYIKMMALAWWESHLKNNDAARAWIEANGAHDWLGGEGEYRRR